VCDRAEKHRNLSVAGAAEAEYVAYETARPVGRDQEPSATQFRCRSSRALPLPAVQSILAHPVMSEHKHRPSAKSHLHPSQAPGRLVASDCACRRERKFLSDVLYPCRAACSSLPAGAGDISDYLLAGPELFPALAFKDMDVKRQLCGPLLPWCEALISDRVV